MKILKKTETQSTKVFIFSFVYDIIRDETKGIDVYEKRLFK